MDSWIQLIGLLTPSPNSDPCFYHASSSTVPVHIFIVSHPGSPSMLSSHQAVSLKSGILAAARAPFVKHKLNLLFSWLENLHYP